MVPGPRTFGRYRKLNVTRVTVGATSIRTFEDTVKTGLSRACKMVDSDTLEIEYVRIRSEEKIDQGKKNPKYVVFLEVTFGCGGEAVNPS